MALYYSVQIWIMHQPPEFLFAGCANSRSYATSVLVRVDAQAPSTTAGAGCHGDSPTPSHYH